MNDILEQITRKIDEMPRVSEAPYRLLKVVSKQDYAIGEVLDIVETDISLTTQCLQMVNSAAFSLPNKVSSIRQAIVLLGSNAIVQIALAQVFKSIFATSMRGYNAQPNDFWEHSIRTALASRIIAQNHLKGIPPDMAYTAGLLHDIGKAIISEFLERSNEELTGKLRDSEMSDFLDIERELLGTDHTQVGEAMARKWKFPEALVAVNRHHHHIVNCPEEFIVLTGVVHIADLLSMMGGNGTGLDSLAYGIDHHVKNYIKFDRTILAEVMLEIDMEFINIKNKFNIFSGDEHVE